MDARDDLVTYLCRYMEQDEEKVRHWPWSKIMRYMRSTSRALKEEYSD